MVGDAYDSNDLKKKEPQVPEPQTTALRSRPPQARGEARRRVLVDAAIALLDEQPLREISFADVAEASGVPLGSIYYHFKSVNELFGQVLVGFRDRLADEVARPYRLSANAEWTTLVEKAIDRIVKMTQTHKAFVEVALNRHAPVQVRYESGQKGGWEFVPIFEEIISRHFVLPDIPNVDRAFLNFVDIVDALFVRAVEETGRVDEASVVEAKRAGIAYLRLYFPEFLPRRDAAVLAEETIT